MNLFTKRVLFLIFLSQTLAACSIYKSAQRKDFESQSLDRVTQSMTQEHCEILSPARTWLEREFPEATTELLVTTPIFEAWKQVTNQQILLITFKSMEQGTEYCQRIYSSEDNLMEAISQLPDFRLAQ
jgi:hypothetical protein